MIWDDGTQFRKSDRSENLLRFPTYPIAVGQHFLYIDFVEISVFAAGQETGAGLGRGSGHLVVTSDDGLGKLTMEVEDEGDEGGTLLEGAGVLGFAVGVETAFVADADGERE